MTGSVFGYVSSGREQVLLLGDCWKQELPERALGADRLALIGLASDLSPLLVVQLPELELG
jgi:hypothetical protein